MTDRLALSVNEFCAKVGISRASLYRMALRGEVRLVKLGCRTLVPVSEVRRLLGEDDPAPAAKAA